MHCFIRMLVPHSGGLVLDISTSLLEILICDFHRLRICRNSHNLI